MKCWFDLTRNSPWLTVYCWKSNELKHRLLNFCYGGTEGICTHAHQRSYVNIQIAIFTHFYLCTTPEGEAEVSRKGKGVSPYTPPITKKSEWQATPYCRPWFCKCPCHIARRWDQEYHREQERSYNTLTIRMSRPPNVGFLVITGPQTLKLAGKQGALKTGSKDAHEYRFQIIPVLMSNCETDRIRTTLEK